MSERKKIDVQYIETEIPVPVRVVYPFDTLEVGNSFVASRNKRTSLQSTASKLKAKTGKEFTVSKINDDQVRVWRTK